LRASSPEARGHRPARSARAVSLPLAPASPYQRQPIHIPNTQQTTELAALDARLDSLRAEQRRLTARLADVGAAPSTPSLDAMLRLRG